MDTCRLEKMGGERMLDRVDVDQEEVTAIQKWADKVTDKLRNISPSVTLLEHDYLYEKQKLGLIKEKTIKIGKVKRTFFCHSFTYTMSHLGRRKE
jgi:hypothetical protein